MANTAVHDSGDRTIAAAMCSATISVVIPTKNRPADLSAAIDSLCTQTCVPDQVIIIDQSPQPSFTRSVSLPVIYVHDPGIPGANAARNVGLEKATGEICLFLDDDVVLERDFIRELMAAYQPGITGVSGIITNYRKPSLGKRIWQTVFVRGPFRDERQDIYYNAAELRNSPPLRVRHFGGGLMSFRTPVIRQVRFNAAMRGYTPGDDTDFCMRLPQRSVLVIAPKARLVHNHSLLERTSRHWVLHHAQSNAYQRRRHWRGVYSSLCFFWLNVGYCLATMLASIRRCSLEPCRAWLEGLRRGFETAGN